MRPAKNPGAMPDGTDIAGTAADLARNLRRVEFGAALRQIEDVECDAAHAKTSPAGARGASEQAPADRVVGRDARPNRVCVPIPQRGNWHCVTACPHGQP